MPEESQRTLRLNQFRGAAMLIMFGVMASRVIGFLRDMYISRAFGAQGETDAYVVAFTIPDLLNYMVAGGALAITFIPILGALQEKGDEQEGHRVLSIVATFLGVILIAGTIVAEIFAPAFLRWYTMRPNGPQWTGEQLAHCVLMTRILIPGPLFFSIGGLLSAVLYTRGSFLVPALTPLIYNLGTIVGAIILGHQLGVTSLAIGTMAGAFLGPFLLPYIAASRFGVRLRPKFELSNPDFKRWLRTTIPLMLGVSIVTADDWIIRKVAVGVGTITIINYAKRLTAVPIAILGQAVGQAAMPFFSKLVTQGNWPLFRETVDRSVARSVMGGIFAVSLLEAISLPVVRLVYQGGKFNGDQAQQASLYFSIFMLSLGLWIAQGIYSRAFYATGNTFAPMVQSTIVTVATIPMYLWLLNAFGNTGLAWASNFAILIQTVSLAWLLHRRGMLQMNRERWLEVLRAITAAVAAGAAAWFVVRYIEPPIYHKLTEAGVALAATAVWVAAVALLSHLLKLDQLKAEVAHGAQKLKQRLGLA